MRSGDPDELSRHDNRTEVSGSAADVVQARHVYGGVHFHGADRSSVPTPQQLPGDVRSFVNRNAELEHLDGVLTDDRDEPLAVALSVITGTAGVGKTSLALHWAHLMRQRFPDGQLYANLRGYDPGLPVTAEEALDRFLRALGEPAAAIPAELEGKAALYRSRLAGQRVLIILDNAASVGQVRPLLTGTAGCLVVVTSRSRLSGLVARDGARRLSLDMLPETEAIALLRAVTAGYRSDDDEAELRELARLCARLPLALRIAAERAASRPLMRLGDLISDLRDESALWDALTAEDDEEADAVRTVFAWSYRALSAEVARLFRLLGLLPGSEFGAEVAAVLINDDGSRVRRQLDVLVGAHLLEQSAPRRYQLHDLLRAYAADQVFHEEAPESRRAALRRVLSWYLHTVDSALHVIFPGTRRFSLEPPEVDVVPMTFAGRTEALDWFEVERSNLVAAAHAASDVSPHRVAWQLSAMLRSIYASRNIFDDWLATSLIGLESARQAGDLHGEAEMLESLGKSSFQARRLAESESYHRAALTIREEIGDQPGRAISINALGLLGLRRRRLADAKSYFEQSMVLSREIGDRRREGLALCNLGEAYYELGEFGEAIENLHAALRVYRELSDRAREGNALFILSMTLRETGDVENALSSIRDALAIAGQFNNRMWEAHWLVELARIQRAVGEPGEALVSCQEAATIQQRLGDRSREAMALHGTGQAYQELGRLQEAADFHRRAAAIHRELGDHWQLAHTLDDLAVTLAATDAAAEASHCRQEALRSLADFEDPKAAAKGERLTEALGRP
ncbi:tetratricopeptide repeat protein [Saccharopolyspora sp. NPDC050389]|uniref:ATP-binding protein n=1 Tax=Saccharopolyspora sp. NPDC050389 TaxID=3155516 RepID=UPI0033F8C6DB